MRLENRIKRMEQQIGNAAQAPEDNLEEVLDRARADFEEQAAALAGLTVDELAALAEDEAQPERVRMNALSRLSAAFPGPEGDKWRDRLKAMEQAELDALKSELDGIPPGPDRYFLEHWIRAKEQIRNNEKTLP
jgi:hypothetical protein